MLNINFPSIPVVIRFRILYLPLCFYENVKLKTYQAIILYSIFYWFETWLVALVEVYRTRLFENRVLRKIFSPKREEMTGRRRKLCSEGGSDGWGMLHAWERILVANPKIKRQLGRLRHIFDDNIKRVSWK